MERTSGDQRDNRSENRHLPWGPFSLAFFGLAFARTWLSLVFVGAGGATTSGAAETIGGAATLAALPHGVFDLAYIAAALFMVVFARRLVPLFEKRAAFAVALGGMLAASIAFVLPAILPPQALPPQAVTVVRTVAAAAGGAAFLTCSMLNCEMLAGVSLLRALIYLSGNNLLGSVLLFFLKGAGVLQTGVAVLVLPVFAVALIHGAHGAIPETDRQKASFPQFTMPWKLYAVVAAFTFVYGLNLHALSAGAGRHSSLSTAIVAGVVFAAAYLFPRRLDVSKLWRAPLPIMLCGVLLIPTEGLFGQVVSSYCISMSFTLMRFIVMLIILDMVKRTGAPVLPLMAVNASLQTFSLLGEKGSDLLAATVGEGAAGVASGVVACILLVAAFFAIFSERELNSRWGVQVLSPESGSLGDAQARDSALASRCDYLVATYRLTSREEEVLHELARGKDTADIARDLMIAPGTLRAHTRHIYEKLGIHTRRELETLVGQAPDA